MPTFPISTSPIYQSYGEAGPKRSVAKTQMEVGPPKVRRRASMGLRRIAAGYVITTSELANFEDWFNDNIGLGVEAFDWPDPRKGTRAVRFVDEDAYSIAPVAPGYWSLSVSLEEYS